MISEHKIDFNKIKEINCLQKTFKHMFSEACQCVTIYGLFFFFLKLFLRFWKGKFF